MRIQYSLFAVALALGLAAQSSAQMGSPGGMTGPSTGPNFGGGMIKLLGDINGFSANVELEFKENEQSAMTMPGKIDYLDTKSRYEMNMNEARGGRLPAGIGEQLKQMGMDRMIVLSHPADKQNILIYPGLKAYAPMPNRDPDAGKSAADFDMEVTELGKESVDGHECIKNKSVVSDKEGNKHEYTVWNATDLKKFPLKIETTEKGNHVTIKFKDVKLAKPDAKLFAAPADYTKYDNMMTMIQQSMMKRMGGGMGRPPGQAPGN